ncbi:MAG: hypothetical protein EXX96DRAFT_535243 [Benjaminiella poitrasii]|nr:MAG: hypothetical protein EXX96DRAFT_535243 [Benjaminiella poitrasii]
MSHIRSTKITLNQRSSQDPKISSTLYNEQGVLWFLQEHRQSSYQYLDGLPSSIASFLKVLHPDRDPLASQKCTINVFKVKKRPEIEIPEKHKLQTWYTNVLKLEFYFAITLIFSTGVVPTCGFAKTVCSFEQPGLALRFFFIFASNKTRF